MMKDICSLIRLLEEKNTRLERELRDAAANLQRKEHAKSHSCQPQAPLMMALMITGAEDVSLTQSTINQIDNVFLHGGIRHCGCPRVQIANPLGSLDLYVVHHDWEQFWSKNITKIICKAISKSMHAALPQASV